MQVNTNVKGIGRDYFWPPNVPRDWSFEQLIDGHGSRRGCRGGADDPSGCECSALVLIAADMLTMCMLSIF